MKKKRAYYGMALPLSVRPSVKNSRNLHFFLIQMCIRRRQSVTNKYFGSLILVSEFTPLKIVEKSCTSHN